MYPLLPFRSLATNVEHAICEVTDDECGLGNTGSLDTGTKNVLVIGNVVWRGNPIDGIEVAVVVSNYSVDCHGVTSLLFGGIVKLIFSRPLKALLNTSIFPQNRDGVANLWRQAIAFNLSRLHEDGLHVVLSALVIER